MSHRVVVEYPTFFRGGVWILALTLQVQEGPPSS